MEIKYVDFLNSILDKNHATEDTFYPLEILELRCSTTFGIGFTELMNMFLCKCGFNVDEISFWKNNNKFYPGTFSFINSMMIEKKYNSNAQATYNMSTNEYIDYYGKLGQELIVEI